MKRLTIICMAALIAMAAACKKEKNESREFDFRATVESQSSGSKTHLEPSGSNSYSVKWDSDDKILVCSKKCGSGWQFDLKSGEGQTAHFNAHDAQNIPDNFYSGEYKAFYPFGMVDASSGNYTISLPQEQTYSENYIASNTFPMATKSDDTSLKFKNLCGVLMLNFRNDEDYAFSVKEVKLISKKADDKLWGKFSINFDKLYDDSEEEQQKVLQYISDSDGDNTLTLNCNGSGGGLKMEKNEVVTFCFAIPAGTLRTGFTVEVSDMNGNVWTKTAPAQTIQRNGITSMQSLPIVLLPEGALPGLFSVADGKQVYFSEGNLWRDGNESDASKQLKFEEKQYYYRSHNSIVQDDQHTTTKVVSAYLYDASSETGASRQITPVNTVGTFLWSVNMANAILTGNNATYGNNVLLFTNKRNAVTGAEEGNIPINGETGRWRTLTNAEWEYLLDERPTTYHTGEQTYNDRRYAEVKINNYVPGLLIFPDDFTWPSSSIAEPTGFNKSSVWNDRTYTDAEFTILQEAGCVFLPAAGSRSTTGGVTTASSVNSTIRYWSSTGSPYKDGDGRYVKAYEIWYDNIRYVASHENLRTVGMPIRLVYDPSCPLN